LTRFLQEHYHNAVVVVGAAGGGDEAVAQAQEQRPDSVLIDLAMPGLPGVEAIGCLRCLLPKGGIIAMTLLGPAGYRQAAIAAGADEFVSKATLVTDLLPAIRHVMQARRCEQGPTDTSRLTTLPDRR
jgi:DNA-binding NarL/FixJ family response regulator